MVEGATPETVVRARRIRIHPKPGQAVLLRKCLSAHRYFWNKAKAFVDKEYASAKDATVDALESGMHLGCASFTPGKACDHEAGSCEVHQDVHGCECRPKKAKHVCMAEGCPVTVSAQDRFGCSAHKGVHGCEARPEPSKCMAQVRSAIRCGAPLVNNEAPVGSSDRYYCEKHSGKGVSVTAKKDGHSIWSPITVRSAIMTSDADLGANEKWQKEIPFDTRQGAIRSFLAAMASFFERRKNHPETEPPGFLRRRSRANSMFTFNKDALSFKDGRLRLFPSRLGNVPVASKDRKHLRKHFESGEPCDGQIVRTTTGKWYVVLPRKVVQAPASPEGGDVYLDPGGRTFNTFYSPDGLVGKIGDGLYEDPSVLGRLVRSDGLMSKANKLDVRSRKRRNVLNRAQALRTKVHDIVRDLHRKTWSFLCGNFRRVFVPEFKAPEMTQVGRRVLNSKAVRNLTTFAHSEFRNGLIEYGRRRGVDVHVVSEAWTTRTCGGCGAIMDVGSRKTVDCSACGLRMDRDHAAARNIFLKTATASGWHP